MTAATSACKSWKVIEAEVEVEDFGVVVVGVRDWDKHTIDVEFVCVKETGEVVTDEIFESGAIHGKESEIRSQCWDSNLNHKIDSIL